MGSRESLPDHSGELTAAIENGHAPGPSTTGVRIGPRLRSTGSVLTGLVAILGLVASLVAVWAQDVLFDPDSVSSAVESALDQPEVTQALAAYLTDQIAIAINVEEYVTEVLPPALDDLALAIASGVRSYVTAQLATLLAEEDVRATLVTLTERSHRALMRLLAGDGVVDGITVADGEVSVNLLPLISRGLLVVQARGLLPDVEVPAFTADGDPAEQRADLGQALERELPPDFGELVVYRSDAVAEAEQSLAAVQRILVLVKRATVAIILLTIVAAAASIWLSRRRTRAALALLLAGVAAMVLVRAIGSRVVERAPDLAIQPGARAAIGSVVASLADGLITAASILAIVGLIAAAAVWLGGDSPAAQRLRGGAGSASGSVGGFVAAHSEAVALASYAAGMLVILVAGIGVFQLIAASVFALAGYVVGRRADEPAS